MATVIIGGGIIGASIAHYLSDPSSSPNANQGHEIHVVDSSAQLFSGASGLAAGFIAKDWFAPALAPLGALSYRLHKQLAAEHDGNRKWGYMPSTALSLNINRSQTDDDEDESGKTGYDWLRDGSSRAEAASRRETQEVMKPAWLVREPGASVEVISEEDTVSQVDPLRLCQFLYETTTSRGVTWHHPAHVVSVITDPRTKLMSSVKVLNSLTQTEFNLPCRNLVICAGPWTSLVYKDLFPSASASARPHVSALAGYSLLVRSPRHTLLHEHDEYKGQSHAVFTTLPETDGRFCPEIFSREGAEIYIAGLNSNQIPLPARAEGSKTMIDQDQLAVLRKVAVRFLGNSKTTDEETTTQNVDDLEIIREGLCFRPATYSGLPIVSRVEDELLGDEFRARDERSTVGRNIGGVFVATGHGPWGISQSLGTGKIIADMVDGIDPTVDVSGLSL